MQKIADDGFGLLYFKKMLLEELYGLKLMTELISIPTSVGSIKITKELYNR